MYIISIWIRPSNLLVLVIHLILFDKETHKQNKEARDKNSFVLFLNLFLTSVKWRTNHFNIGRKYGVWDRERVYILSFDQYRRRSVHQRRFQTPVTYFFFTDFICLHGDIWLWGKQLMFDTMIIQSIIYLTEYWYK